MTAFLMLTNESHAEASCGIRAHDLPLTERALCRAKEAADTMPLALKLRSWNGCCARPNDSRAPKKLGSPYLLNNCTYVRNLKYTWPESSWRPSACEADVIATIPQVLLKLLTMYCCGVQGLRLSLEQNQALMVLSQSDTFQLYSFFSRAIF